MKSLFKSYKKVTIFLLLVIFIIFLIFSFNTRISSPITGMAQGNLLDNQQTQEQRKSLPIIKDIHIPEQVIYNSFYFDTGFKAEIAYNYDNYNKLWDGINNMILTCGGTGAVDVDKCVQTELDKIKSSTGFIVTLGGCDYDYEKTFNRINEVISQCLSSPEPECRCEVPIDNMFSKEAHTISIWYDQLNKKTVLYEPISDSEARAEFLKNKKIGYYDPDITSTPYLINEPLTLRIEQGELFVESPSAVKSWLDIKSSQPIKKLGFSKINGRPDAVFFRPDIEKPEYENLPLCDISSNFYKICIEDLNTKVKATDKIEKKFLGEVTLKYRIAVEIPDLPPAPLTGVNVYNAPLQKYAFLLVWNKSDATDVKFYNIYYKMSLDPLNDISLANGKTITELLNPPLNYNLKSVDIKGEIKLNADIDFNQLICDPAELLKESSKSPQTRERYCYLKTKSGTPFKVEKDKLYLLNNNVYIYLIYDEQLPTGTKDLDKDSDYLFIVRARDKKGVYEQISLSDIKQAKTKNMVPPNTILFVAKPPTTKPHLEWVFTTQDFFGDPLTTPIQRYEIHCINDNYIYYDNYKNSLYKEIPPLTANQIDLHLPPGATCNKVAVIPVDANNNYPITKTITIS